MVFKSENELKTFLLRKCRNALIKSQEQVYQIIDRFVKEFYSEYSPEMYERTRQLYHSLVKSEIISTANGYEAQVYFDFESLKYTTGSEPSGKQVMDAAAWGGHGAQGLYVVDAGGFGIWNQPKKILSSKAINILKEMLIAEGIPIR